MTGGVQRQIPVAEIGQAMSALADTFINESLEWELKQCADVCRREIAGNYDRGGSALGAWPPHAPATVARYGPHPLLILSGDMQAASVQQGAKGHIEQINDRQLTMGVDASTGGIIYAMAQQFGHGRIPPRPFIVIGDEAIQQCKNIVTVGMHTRLW